MAGPSKLQQLCTHPPAPLHTPHSRPGPRGRPARAVWRMRGAWGRKRRSRDAARPACAGPRAWCGRPGRGSQSAGAALFTRAVLPSGARVALPSEPRAVPSGPLLSVLLPKARKVQRSRNTVQIYALRCRWYLSEPLELQHAATGLRHRMRAPMSSR